MSQISCAAQTCFRSCPNTESLSTGLTKSRSACFGTALSRAIQWLQDDCTVITGCSLGPNSSVRIPLRTLNGGTNWRIAARTSCTSDHPKVSKNRYVPLTVASQEVHCFVAAWFGSGVVLYARIELDSRRRYPCLHKAAFCNWTAAATSRWLLLSTAEYFLRR